MPFALCALLFRNHEKIRFHEHHPEYRGYWSADSGNDANTTPTTYDNHNSFRLPEHDASDEPRTLQVRGVAGGGDYAGCGRCRCY